MERQCEILPWESCSAARTESRARGAERRPDGLQQSAEAIVVACAPRRRAEHEETLTTRGVRWTTEPQIRRLRGRSTLVEQAAELPRTREEKRGKRPRHKPVG